MLESNIACKLFFAGDVVLGENCFEKKLLNKDFYNVIQDCDIICCNLEAPLKGENEKATKKIGPNNFNVEDVIPSLRESGFNLVTLANNHIFDFGICGINKTLEVLSYNNVDYIGAGVTFDSIYKPYIKNCNGIKVCIINAAENGFGAAVDGQTYGYAYI